jgi:hypothetical protein
MSGEDSELLLLEKSPVLILMGMLKLAPPSVDLE